MTEAPPERDAARERRRGSPGTGRGLLARWRGGEASLAASDRYWPAQLAVLAALALHVTLPERLTLGPRWVFLALEGSLLLGLVVTTPRRSSEESPLTRGAAILLVALVSAANLVSLVFLVHVLVSGARASGQELILSAIQIWLTNVLIFGLWFWELDRGGPGRRSGASAAGSASAAPGSAPAAAGSPDFLFPQMSSPDIGPRDWSPGFIDYLYVSFTNAAAFSPTDTMPLTPWAKTLMLVEALASLITVALVAGRAVNILG